MEATALCFRLMMSVLFLLCALHQEVDSVSFRVEPNKLQYFEYDTVTFHCDGSYSSTEWKVKKKDEEESVKCSIAQVTSAGFSCTVRTLYQDDSGEHWCEAGWGERSGSIYITVTGGPVILESPALPVMEGDDVTLSCRNKTTPSDLTADFYKDGLHIKSSSTGEMTIHSVSTSDEGLYKCNISGAGNSPESQLAVRAHSSTIPGNKETTPCTPAVSSPTPWIIVTVLLLVLLLLVGLHHLGKGHWHTVLMHLSALTPGSRPAEDQTEAGAAEVNHAVYAPVRKKNKNTDDDELLSSPIYYTLDQDQTQPQAVPPESSVTAIYATPTDRRPSVRDNPLYSTVQQVAQ